MTYVPTKRYAIGYGRSRVALGRSNHFKTSTDTRLQVSERLSIGQFQTFCTNEMKYDGLVGPGYNLPRTGGKLCHKTTRSKVIVPRDAQHPKLYVDILVGGITVIPLL